MGFRLWEERMTDFFILAVAVFVAVVLARMLTRRWTQLDRNEELDL